MIEDKTKAHAKNRANAWKLMLTLLAAEILSAFELSMLYPALRSMIADFGSTEAVGWVMTSFFLSSAVFAAIVGRLGDLFGRQRMMLMVIVISIIGSLVAGFSSTLSGVILGRVIQGAAGAIFPLCIGLVRENVKKESVPIFIGTLAASLTVTMGMGTFFGGVIVDTLGWHWIFFAGAIAGFVALFATLFWMPVSGVEAGGRKQLPNFLSGIFFAPGITLLLLGITKASSWGWTNNNTIFCLIGGVLFLVIWIWRELNAETPLLDVRLLANRQVLLANSGSVVLGLTSFQSLHIWSIVLQQPTSTGIGLGASATVAGMVSLPMTLIALIAGPAAGWLISRYSGRAAMGAGAILMTLAWFSLGVKHDSLLSLTLLLMFLGFGTSMFYSSIPILISQAVPMDRTSEASGMMIVIRSTAMGIGAQVVASLLGSSTVTVGSGNYPDETGLFRAIAYVIVGCVLMVIIASRLSKGRALNGYSSTATE